VQKGHDPVAIALAFVDRVEETSDPVFLAIDPGASGAIALLCGRHCDVFDIPVIKVEVKRTKKTTKKEFAETGHKTKTVAGTTTKPDYAGICAVFRALKPIKARVVVALEEVPTSMGPGRHNADVMLNRAWAMWPLYLFGRGYRVEDVRPSEWKQKMGLTGKDKKHSRLKAMKLFPKAGERLCREEDHDRAEALLIAEYIKRVYSGNAPKGSKG
jgi:hypothetical protein